MIGELRDGGLVKNEDMNSRLSPINVKFLNVKQTNLGSFEILLFGSS